MSINKITFDSNGYLESPTPSELTLSEFEEYFVKAFPKSDRRKWLFENYLQYTNRFQNEIFPHFEQWIDGSFISKKENPKDIDIVTFLDYNVYDLRDEDMINQFFTFSLFHLKMNLLMLIL